MDYVAVVVACLLAFIAWGAVDILWWLVQWDHYRMHHRYFA